MFLLIIISYIDRHTHESVDQILSRIAQALARLLTMTFVGLCRIFYNAYDHKHKVLKLSRTFNVHAWLQGKVELPVLQRHWSDITEAQQFFIETCARLDDGTDVPTRVTIRTSELSLSPWSLRMVSPVMESPVRDTHVQCFSTNMSKMGKRLLKQPDRQPIIK
jgi:hypothetical protein